MNERDDQKDLLDLFAPAMKDAPLQPPVELRQRLLARVAASKAAHAGQIVVRGRDGEWKGVKPGVRAKKLRESDGGSSVLIELAPGASLPPHRHRHLEEGIVLRGSMQMGELDLGPGDYHVSSPGSRHALISSRDGCLTYLRGSSLGDMLGVVVELLGGLLPGDGEPPVTITTKTGEWRPITDGVNEKRLWHDDTRGSRFLRFAPDARVADMHCPLDSEFLVVSGDVFCGDILLRSHEFLSVPAGTQHEELSSDVGGMLFMHSGLSIR